MLLITSCATLSGGIRYHAHIEVPNQPNADIYYNNKLIGVGKANIKLKRLEARNLKLSIIARGCEKEEFIFYGDKTRAWSIWYAFPANFFFLGAAVDIVSGSWRKPNDSDPRIDKIDVNTYKYIINYQGCKE